MFLEYHKKGSDYAPQRLLLIKYYIIKHLPLMHYCVSILMLQLGFLLYGTN